jgi:hypothetical protein
VPVPEVAGLCCPSPGRPGNDRARCLTPARPARGYGGRDAPGSASPIQPGCSQRSRRGCRLSQLVAFYDENPVEVGGKVEIHQSPVSSAVGAHSPEGVIRASLVYVHVPSERGLLVPFGTYDEWSLRDRYNEALRIMSTLGAATVTCEAFREIAIRRGVRARLLGRGGELTQQRLENSGFDYRHNGTGSAARDPRPLRWPDEPGFAAAVANVLDNGVTDVDINIRSNRTHAVDGALGVQLKTFGFDLGGEAQSAGATSLHIHATFPQGRKMWQR